MMKDNLGFTLVELLAVIIILGILMSVGFAAFGRYKDKAVRQSFETMSSDAASAAEEYFMDYRTKNSVDFSTLVAEDYLTATVDPRDSKRTCGGEVEKQTVISGTTDDALDVIPLKVTIDCGNYTECKIYPGKKNCP